MSLANIGIRMVVVIGLAAASCSSSVGKCASDSECPQGTTCNIELQGCFEKSNACPSCTFPENSTGRCDSGACEFSCNTGYYRDGPSCSQIGTLAGGELHSCMALKSGAMKCWGSNEEGQLGNTSVVGGSPSPAQVTGLDAGVVAIATGIVHTCAAMADGTGKCWGQDFSRLGSGYREREVLPTDIEGLGGALRMVAAGAYHTCGILEGGSMQCWGKNTLGQVGKALTGDFFERFPTAVQGLSGKALSVALGGEHSCALIEGGTVQCWGKAEKGQLGTNVEDTSPHPMPATVALSGVMAIAAGLEHTCALLGTGRVKCWGANDWLQLGNAAGTPLHGPRAEPVDVAGLTDAIAIAAGEMHTCALLTNRTVRCWGGNLSGQRGTQDQSETAQPERVPDIEGVDLLVTGRFHTCVKLTDGQAKCWGQNNAGQLGSGSTSLPSAPVKVLNE